METNINTQNKRPVTFTIFGWISVIAGIIFTVQSIMAAFAFWAGYILLPPEFIRSISVSFQIAFLGVPVILALLYFVEGIGFLKLKRWLPNLLLISLILSFALQVMAYFDSVSYIIDPVQALGEYFLVGAIPLYIGAIVVGYTFKKRALLIN